MDVPDSVRSKPGPRKGTRDAAFSTSITYHLHTEMESRIATVEQPAYKRKWAKGPI